MKRAQHNAKPVMTYEAGTSQALAFLYGCRPAALDRLTADDLCRFHRVREADAVAMLLKARTDRAGEIR